MKYAIAMILAAVLLQGCAVNVVVAPHARMTVDSYKDSGNVRATSTHDVYEAACLPDSDNCSAL